MVNDISPEEYYKIAKRVFDMIKIEIDTNKDIETMLPKLIIMVEFFSFIRGESFVYVGLPRSEFQKELYNMENELKNIKIEMEKQIEKSDRYKDKMNEFKKLFEY